jgi:hypothetical protein
LSTKAKPGRPISGREDYCAFSIANVTVTPDKDGKMKEQVTELMTNLWVPKSMFDYLAQFEHASARTTGV